MRTVIYIDEFVTFESQRHCRCGGTVTIQELKTYGCCEMCYIKSLPLGFDVDELLATGSLGDIAAAFLAAA